MSNSARPHRRHPTKLPHSWDSPGKNTGVGCHFLLQCMKVKSESEVTQSCRTQWPHGLQSFRLLRPWDFPGKSTGVGRYCLLHRTWQKLVRTTRSKMGEEWTLSGPWASLCAHCNILAYQMTQLLVPMTFLKWTTEVQKVGSGLIPGNLRHLPK